MALPSANTPAQRGFLRRAYYIAGMKHLLFSLALLGLPVLSFAQSATPVAYEFLTMIESESRFESDAKLLFAPDFQGKSEMKLQELTLSPLKNSDAYRHNVQVVNQQLAAATAEGWELVSCFGSDVASSTGGARYLLRRAKR